MYMQKKTKIIIVVCVLLYIALIIVTKRAEHKRQEEIDQLYAQGSDTRQEQINTIYEIIEANKHLLDHPMELNMFKQENEFQFGDIPWNITLEQVEKRVSYSLIDASEEIKVPEGYKNYISKDRYKLYGQFAFAHFVFNEEQLKVIQLDFSTSKRPKALFDSSVELLIDICGKESERIENEATGGVDYKWQGETTILQISYYDSRVVMKVGLAEGFEKVTF